MSICRTERKTQKLFLSCLVWYQRYSSQDSVELCAGIIYPAKITSFEILSYCLPIFYSIWVASFVFEASVASCGHLYSQQIKSTCMALQSHMFLCVPADNFALDALPPQWPDVTWFLLPRDLCNPASWLCIMQYLYYECVSPFLF